MQECFGAMKFFAYVLLVVSGAIAAGAQAKPAAQPAAAAHAAKPAATARAAGLTKLPPGIPVVHGVIRPMFTLRYEDYKLGAGPVAETNKVYHVLYTGYLAATGEKFDSSDDHRAPVMKDGKPVMGPDCKPQLGEPQPLVFPQGFGRLIPGFDQGVAGMRIGGKRRIFIPWQLAYGTRDIPARAGHPGIPPKSDLIFDVELVDVTDMPQMPQRPMSMPAHPGAPGAPAQPARPGAPAAPPSGTAPASPATPPAASAPAKPAEPAQHAAAPQQQSAPAAGTQPAQAK